MMSCGVVVTITSMPAPPRHGALLKNEQDVHPCQRVVFMARAGR
jgi:hypothetical protein